MMKIIKQEIQSISLEKRYDTCPLVSLPPEVYPHRTGTDGIEMQPV